MGLVSEDGEMMGHAFVWQDGRMIDLAPPAGFEWSRAVAINDQGWIIGCAGRGDEYASYTTPNRKHAVLWTWQPAQ
jgi:uncharacterized membrane protein